MGWPRRLLAAWPAKAILALLILDQLLFWSLLTRPAASLSGLIQLTDSETPPHYRLRPNLATTWTLWREADATPIHTNSLGFRSPERPLAKPPDRQRVVLMGDSVTFGIGVSDADSLGVQLQQALTSTAIEVWNAGVPGYAMADFRGALGAQVLPLAPDLVLLQLSRNDSLVPLRLGPGLLGLARFSGLARAWLLLRFNFLSDHAAYVRDLAAFLQLARQHAVPVLIWPEGVPDRQNAELVALAARHGAVVRAIHSDSLEKLPGDPHFSPRGNAEAARRLVPWVRGSLDGTLPWTSSYP